MTDQQRMPVGIRFKNAGKIYYFDARGFEPTVGSYLIVDTSHGQEIGRVVVAPDQVIVSEIKETLKPILRLAEREDLDRAAELKKAAAEKLGIARRKADDSGLDMHVIAADYSLDGSQLTFYFNAKDRVDFRTLVRDLSSEFDAKVQLLQVGERDRAKMADGIGRCGERLCCSSWQTVFPTVSIKMAKEQSLPLNPSKLSGACGRLLCCLTFEYDAYREIKGGLPKVGSRISTPTGEAKVLNINVPKETISLALAGETGRLEMPLDQFRLMYGTAIRPTEITEGIEKEIMAAAGPESAAAAPAAPASPPSQEAKLPTAEQPAGEPGKRRRRRRGGRRRRKPSGS